MTRTDGVFFIFDWGPPGKIFTRVLPRSCNVKEK